jgi:hypothetical protein
VIPTAKSNINLQKSFPEERNPSRARRSQVDVAFEPLETSLLSAYAIVSNDHVRANFHRRHRRRYPCEPDSNPGRTPVDRLVVRRAQLLVGRNPNRSQAYPVQEQNDSHRRRNPPDRFSLPYGMVCSVLELNNHVPGRTSDLQR